MTAIFAQNQLIFVFRGIQPNMNMEITRQMDIKNFIGTYGQARTQDFSQGGVRFNKILLYAREARIK